MAAAGCWLELCTARLAPVWCTRQAGTAALTTQTHTEHFAQLQHCWYNLQYLVFLHDLPIQYSDTEHNILVIEF